MNIDYKARLKSLGWRLGMMILAVVIDWALKNLNLVNLTAEFTVLLGLILGEVSKAINNELTYRQELK